MTNLYQIIYYNLYKKNFHIFQHSSKQYTIENKKETLKNEIIISDYCDTIINSNESILNSNENSWIIINE